MTNTLRLAAANLAVGVAVASGCEAPAAAQAPPQPEIVTLVGDSISSGYGGDTNPYWPTDMNQYDRSTTRPGENECYQLNRPHGVLAAEALGASSVNKLGCAGITTAHIISESIWGEGPQSTRVNKDSTLIIANVGANDVLFAEFLDCVANPLNTKECTKDSEVVVKGQHILDYELPERLDNTVAALRQQAPEALILLEGYADMLPQSPSELNHCATFMTPGELELGRTYESNLNTQIAAAAERGDDKVVFVDPNAPDSPFKQRDLLGFAGDSCSPSAAANSWSLRVADVALPGPTNPNFSFHYTPKGHELMASIAVNVVYRERNK